MSYLSTDTSTQDGKPLYLVEFTRAAQVVRLNSGAFDIPSPVGVYAASHFSITARTQGKDIFKDDLKITFARADNFAREYIAGTIDHVTTVAIKRLHFGMYPSDAVVEWKGRIVTAEIKKEEITLICESIYTSMRRLGLATQFEISCVHTIYSSGCRAVKGVFRTDAIVANITGQALTFSGISGYPNGWFASGFMELPGGGRRFITSHDGNVVTVSKQLSSNVGDVIALFPGCDKRLSTCLNKFSNLDNYLGFPWVPDQNPFGGQPIARI